MLTDSKFGFGLMRLPKDAQGNISISEVSRMVDAYMESGFNYFDTAYVYGGSEVALRKSLVDRYPRESFTIANKLPAWKIQSEDDLERIFNESLELCGVEYFDFYLLHSLEKAHLPKYEDFGCFDFLVKMKQEGKIKNIGFSYHDGSDLLDEVLTRHTEVDFVQLQINYFDWDNGVIQSKRNYDVAMKHNKPVIVMEPVKGGTLASFPPEVEKIYKDYSPEKSIASWALRFVASNEGVMTVLSGMSNEVQMNDNLETMKNFQPLSDVEMSLINQVKEKMLSIPNVPCTACRYCVPGCPMNIQIPDLFTAYNSVKTYGTSSRYNTYYKDHTADENNPASACIKCGQCETVCPQHIEIMDFLDEVANVFEAN